MSGGGLGYSQTTKEILALNGELLGQHKILGAGGVIGDSNRHVIMRIYNELSNLLRRDD